MTSTIFKSLLDLSPFADHGRMVVLFRGTSGPMVVEFPPDDSAQTALLGLMRRPSCQCWNLRSSEKLKKNLNKLRDTQSKNVSGGSRAYFNAGDYNTLRSWALSTRPNTRQCMVYTYETASDEKLRLGIQAHPCFNAEHALEQGAGPVCSVASGASLGCAFIARASRWDGVHFNDPFAHLYCPVEPFGVTAEGDDKPYFVQMLEYTVKHRDVLDECHRLAYGEPVSLERWNYIANIDLGSGVRIGI